MLPEVFVRIFHDFFAYFFALFFALFFSLNFSHVTVSHFSNTFVQSYVLPTNFS